MNKYVVSLAIPVFLSIEVEAENEDSAIEAASEYAYLTSYAGNGGTGKLVGTSQGCVTIEPGDEIIESGGFSIIADLIA